MSGYKQDHIKIMKVLGSDVPKRPAFKVSDIVTVGFKGAENGDRRVRNGMRKLRSDDLVEICERGEYRLLPGGVSKVQQWSKDGWPTGKEKAEAKPAKAKVAKKKASKKAAAKKVSPKKAAAKAKKAVKAAAKPKAKPTKKAAPKKAAPKKAEDKKAAPKKAPKIDMKKAASKVKDEKKDEKKAEPKAGNGVAKNAEKVQGAAASQLAF